MTEQLPKAISEARITIFGVELIVVQLDDGRRVIEGESLSRFFDALGSDAINFTDDDAMKVANLIAAPIPAPAREDLNEGEGK